MKYSQTAATRALTKAGITFIPHLYDYEEKGGTRHSSASLGVDEHMVVKTLIMETEERSPLVVLMHGDRTVSTKELARHLHVKTVTPCTPETAHKHSGYLVGGTSPFGTKKLMPVYVERSILSLPRIYINGGKRGFLVEMNPTDLKKALSIHEVEVAIVD